MTRRANQAQGRSFPWEGMDEDRRNALLLYGAIGLIVLIAFALVAWGYYSDRIAPRHETVLTVGDRNFDLAYLERRVEADLKAGTADTSGTLEQLVVTTLQRIELEELARQAAHREGLHITGEDIDNEIKRRVGFPAEASRDSFAAAYRQDVLRLGLPVKEYREILAAQVARVRLIEGYEAGLPDEAEQVNAQLIRVADQAAAQAAKKRIDDGENMTRVAVEASIDQSKANGGQLGWRTREEFRPGIADAFFTLPVGQVSEPIQDQNGWYLLMAIAREVRAIDVVQKDQIAQAKYAILLEDTRTDIGSMSRLTQEQIVRIGRELLG